MCKEENKKKIICIAYDKFYKVVKKGKVLGFVSVLNGDQPEIDRRYRIYSPTGSILGRKHSQPFKSLENAVKKLT